MPGAYQAYQTVTTATNGTAESTEDSTTSSLSSVNFGEITEEPPVDSLTVSAALHYCKCKILMPYLRLLSVMGLRPLSFGPLQSCSCMSLLGYVHLSTVLVLMCVGYLLQYMSCFRRDRGFYYKPLEHERVCYGSVLFSYIVPSILHLAAYLYALYLFRITENEQLQNLMERVFLASSNQSIGMVTQRRLVWILWLFIGLSILWMGLSLISVNVMMAQGVIVFHWLEHSSKAVQMPLKILLVLSTLWHDMVQATLITSYCLQGQLLTSHVQFLAVKLLQHSITPLDWIRDIGEFHKLLKYLNDDLSPVVCIFTIVNISYAVSGMIWLLHLDHIDRDTPSIEGISLLNVVLWFLISVVPFVQAARLTSACKAIQTLGHEIRGRPFVYQETPGADLDTVLLYTGSLRMSSKLFLIPITGRYLCLSFTVGTIVVLTLGQCHVIHT